MVEVYTAGFFPVPVLFIHCFSAVQSLVYPPISFWENSKNSHEKTRICKNSHDAVLNFKTSHLHIKFRCSPDSVRTTISHIEFIQREKYPLVKWLGGWC